MRSNLIRLPCNTPKTQIPVEDQSWQSPFAPESQRTPYEEAEDLFATLIVVDELDRNLLTYASEIQNFESCEGTFPTSWGVSFAKKGLFHTPSACGGVVDFGMTVCKTTPMSDRCICSRCGIRWRELGSAGKQRI
jgi:hypothetical protein